MKILHHPGICKIKEIIETQQQIFMIIELVQQGDLLQYVLKKTFLEEIEAHKIFRQLMDTLVYLENASILNQKA